MRLGRAIPLLLTLVLTASLLPTLPVAADSNPPTVTDIRWDPRYPIHPSNVTLYARVTDPDGVKSVMGTFCYIPSMLCLWADMYDPNADDVYNGTPVSGEGFSTSATALGAEYEVIATDNAMNTAVTPKQIVLFVDSLDLTVDDDTLGSAPGEIVNATGTAFYESNLTAPAEGVTVSATVDGVPFYGVVNETGQFWVLITSPTTEGTYPVSFSATDRTLTGTDDASLVVTALPRPDLIIEEVQGSTTDPVAGRRYTISFEAENIGTANATDARVVVDVVHDGETRHLLNATYNLTASGTANASVTLSANWTLAQGVYTVYMRIDPWNAIEETSESNNEANLTFTARAFDPRGRDANADEDGDGFTNLEEVQAGSDPWDPNSVPSSLLDAWPIFLVVILLVVAVVATLLIRRRRRADTSEVPPERK